jgi:glycosyltransferase involved in cell wall biosynthesis
MALGKPMIVTDIGGMPDLVTQGRTGLIVRINDPIALADAMNTLLLNSDLRSRMGEACRVGVEKLKARAVVDRIVHVYEALLRDRIAPARCDATSKALPRPSA